MRFNHGTAYSRFCRGLSMVALGLLCCLCEVVHAAISVGPAGSGVLNFDSLPAADALATLSLAGSGTSLLYPTNVDAAVAGLSASGINRTLVFTKAIPPSTATSGFVYNEVWQVLQSRPAGVAAIVLKATLRNDTGQNVSSLQINYDLDKQSDVVPGELPGHYVYYSLTGQAGSWTKVEQFYGNDVVGRHSAVVTLPSWPPGAEIYILWLDDNNNSGADPSYTLDNLSFVPFVQGTNSSSGISVPAGGTALMTFDTLPAAAEWSTLSIPGLATDIQTASVLDGRVQTLDATNVNEELRVSTAYPPSGNLVAAWSSSFHFLVTRPTGCAFHVLMGTFRNHTGRIQQSLRLSYTLADVISNGTTNAEEVAGQRVFFSLSGAPNSWQIIPEFSTGQTGALTATLHLGSWPDGALLFVLWADDNSNADANDLGLEEGAYTIDNMIAEPPIVLRLARRSTTRGLLLWPLPSSGYQLQETADLGASWQPASASDVPVGPFHTVEVDLTSSSRFFRLQSTR
jgi:hypothetical protein